MSVVYRKLYWVWYNNTWALAEKMQGGWRVITLDSGSWVPESDVIEGYPAGELRTRPEGRPIFPK